MTGNGLPERALHKRLSVFLMAVLLLSGCQKSTTPADPSVKTTIDEPASPAKDALPPPSAEELAAIRADLESLRVKQPPAPPSSADGSGHRSPGLGANTAEGGMKSNSSLGTASANAIVSGPGVAQVAAALELFGEAVPVLPEARQVKLLIPNKTFRQEGRERALRVSFDDIDLLKVLNMDPVTEDAVEKMPDWLASLSGKRIRIRGFMYPPSFAEGITQFPLARDNQICCFGRNPQVYDIIEVKLKDGSETNYIENRPFDVVGTFRIQAVDSGIGIGGLYYLDEAEVLER